VPVLMRREKKSPNVTSLCVILSSTDLIVLPILCRARSEADIARRLHPPSPTRERAPRLARRSLFRLLSTLDVSRLLGFFQSFAPLRKPPPVCDLGLLVEHLARITQTADMDSRLFEILIPARQAACGLTGFVIIALACDSSRQIEHVEFSLWMTQQMGEVSEPLSVLQTKRFLAVADGPVLALFAEHPFSYDTDARSASPTLVKPGRAPRVSRGI
jgi:hypothetical protein